MDAKQVVQVDAAAVKTVSPVHPFASAMPRGAQTCKRILKTSKMTMLMMLMKMCNISSIKYCKSMHMCDSDNTHVHCYIIHHQVCAAVHILID